MTGYTDFEQSKKLAEILPLESADMRYAPFGDTHPWVWDEEVKLLEKGSVPCWSLSALLDILECPVLQKDKIGDGKEAWMVSCYPDGARVDSYWNESPIDACVKMIVKLKEK